MNKGCALMKRKNNCNGKRIMLIGAYGMEIVECGGTLYKNVLLGGVSHAVIAFASSEMRKDLVKSAEILNTSVEFIGLDVAEISASPEEKKLVINEIRKFKPDIVITQCPEHHVSDLDPGRRPFMTLALESLSLAGRNYAVDEYEPHAGATLYYMTPAKPNCIVDILDAWEKKCEAMNILHTQLEFSSAYYEREFGENELKKLVPEWSSLKTPLEKGTAIKTKIDLATHMFYGACGHSATLFSEAFRKAELFELDNLLI